MPFRFDAGAGVERALCDGEREYKPAAPANCTLGPDPAALQFDETLGKGKAKPRARRPVVTEVSRICPHQPCHGRACVRAMLTRPRKHRPEDRGNRNAHGVAGEANVGVNKSTASTRHMSGSPKRALADVPV